VVPVSTSPTTSSACAVSVTTTRAAVGEHVRQLGGCRLGVQARGDGPGAGDREVGLGGLDPVGHDHGHAVPGHHPGVDEVPGEAGRGARELGVGDPALVVGEGGARSALGGVPVEELPDRSDQLGPQHRVASSN
jgi:hypothetical protein